jgi:hypothetical protein
MGSVFIFIGGCGFECSLDVLVGVAIASENELDML